VSDLLQPSALSGVNVAEPVWREWREELAVVGGSSPLLQFVDTPRTRIDLSSMHPGGLPQLISGKATLLSSLIREEFALRNARLAASALTAKSMQLRSMRGLEAVYLGVGLARWTFGDIEYCGPVLVRPLSLRRFGKDFELKLQGQPQLNPQLARALESQFHISLDADAFVALASDAGSFNPQPVMERLRGLTSHVPGFSVEARLVASTFADVAASMVADVADLRHPVLDALAGNIRAREVLNARQATVSVPDQDVRPPATDTLVLDADPDQERVIAEIGAGNSIVVEALPGTGGTQTIVNALGALVASHNRVLVVSARQSSLDAIAQRATAAGLDGLVVSPRTLRRDLISAILRNEKASRPNMSEVDDALLRLRKVLVDSRSALTTADSKLGVSALDALEELSRLSLSEHPPATTARLPRRAMEALAFTRAEAAESLITAAALGEFRYGPDDSPWYGASFATGEQTSQAHELAKRIHQAELPKLLERADEVFGRTRMRPFETLAELGIYLRLVLDIRETLDRFVPSVYDRPLTELIEATSGRRNGEMSGANRRRLKKLAFEYVRPGASITDMHASLVKIQQQRILWQRYVVAGSVPEVPSGVGDLLTAYQRLMLDLSSLDAPLGTAGTDREFAALPLAALRTRIAGLAADSEVLANLQERNELLAHLRELNLDELLADLSSRHVPQEQVAAELELAWWQSVLEDMIASNKALLGADTQVLDRLEADFRLVDEAHANANGALLAARLAELWQIGLVDYADEAERLRQRLRGPGITPGEFAELAPRLGRSLAPVWMCSPYEAHLVPRSLDFDVVMLVDAGATTVAENAGAITRGKSLVVFGDPVTQTPSRFDTAMAEPGTEAPVAEADLELWAGRAALAQFAEILPVFTLTRSYRAGGEELADIVNRRFYDGRISSLPWAGTFLGRTSVRLRYIADGTGMPDIHSGAVESVDAEVAAVVELVLAHAAERPTESLMVVTVSPRHAERVEQSVLSAFARRPELADFLLAAGDEQFEVLTLEQAVAQTRDRVIFSLGYGRTPHGRLLSDFGALARPGGERLLALAMTRARRSMEIVSCFRPGDLEESRLSPGMRALAAVLEDTVQPVPAPSPELPAQPMLVDLAERLTRRGVHVQLGYGGQIPLAASFEGKAVAVETDAALTPSSLRSTLRLRPLMLRRLGWHYLGVHSFELFADPEAVAERVARLIGAGGEND
jgi:hypothetical protein